jgi:hypothetical protein
MGFIVAQIWYCGSLYKACGDIIYCFRLFHWHTTLMAGLRYKYPSGHDSDDTLDDIPCKYEYLSIL